MAELQGIEVPALTAWFERCTGAQPPLSFALMQGGRSNLTYQVDDSRGRRWVLRRPPLHGVLASAHDMGREHRIIAALGSSDIPVPATVAFEPDEALTGAPFYVMAYVDGVVARDVATVRAVLPTTVRAAAATDLVDVLAYLHAVDPDEVGLGDLGRRDGYIARQLRRWHGQLQLGGTRPLPLLDEVHDRLLADVPAQRATAIVHGDYRLDNLVLDATSGRVRAVLDWELTTLGDPLADLALLLVYWSRPGDATMPLGDAPTVADGFPSRTEVVERYARTSGRDLTDLEFYVAFALWKLACILEGVYTRTRSGAYGQPRDAAVEGMGGLVLELGERAAEAAAAAGR